MTSIAMRAIFMATLALAQSGSMSPIYILGMLNNIASIGSFIAWVISFVFIAKLTMLVASRYQIAENESFGLYLISCCCLPCSLARLARHTGRAQGFIQYQSNVPQ